MTKFVEKFDVADVEDIKATRGEYYFFTLSADFFDNWQAVRKEIILAMSYFFWSSLKKAI
ncbi:MAG: hypothetical protein G01um101416_1076 [Microgenomates group bacterium Gr01-1014_16]|nr:MAG: hypothetical protein G01um101416_1076 [Microgenomates group bacterium Gr01-1014_16]